MVKNPVVMSTEETDQLLKSDASFGVIREWH